MVSPVSQAMVAVAWLTGGMVLTAPVLTHAKTLDPVRVGDFTVTQ